MFKPTRLCELEKKFLFFFFSFKKFWFPTSCLCLLGEGEDQKSITRLSKNVHPTEGKTKPMMKQHIQPLWKLLDEKFTALDCRELQ